MKFSSKNLKNIGTELKHIIEREENYYYVKPTHALLFITYRCTSQCKICTIWKRSKRVDRREELTLAQWISVIDMLSELGVSIIEFFGGDALLRKDILIPLIRYAHSKSFFTELPTNSNLLNGTTAIDLVNSGLDVIWLSLDGIGDAHDSIRGIKGTFANVHRAILELKKAKGSKKSPKICINCVVLKSNLNSFEQIIPYAQKMGVDSIDFEYVGEIPSHSIKKSKIDGLVPQPFFVSQGESALLNREESIFLKEKLDVIGKSPNIDGMRVNTGKIDFLTIENLVTGQFPNERCYICRDIVTIDPYGNVMGCLHFNNYYLGNIKIQPLRSIWKNNRHIKFINSQKRGDIDICRYCSNGMLRNYTPSQSLRSFYYEITRKARR